MGTSGYKSGVQGLAPGVLSPDFLQRKSGSPAGVGGSPGALRPEVSKQPRPPEGYAVPHRAPARDRAGTHVAGLDLRRSYRDHLPILAPLGPGTSPTYWTTKLRFIHFPLR